MIAANIKRITHTQSCSLEGREDERAQTHKHVRAQVRTHTTVLLHLTEGCHSERCLHIEAPYLFHKC